MDAIDEVGGVDRQATRDAEHAVHTHLVHWKSCRKVEVPNQEMRGAKRQLQPRLRQAKGVLCLALLGQQGLCALLLDEELTLILAAVDGVKDRHVVEDRLALTAHDGVDQRRQRPPATADEIELHLGDRPLHLQQRQPVRLVEDLAAHGEEILQSLAAQLGRAEAQPGAQGAVHREDGTVASRRQETARSVVVTRLGPRKWIGLVGHRSKERVDRRGDGVRGAEVGAVADVFDHAQGAAGQRRVQVLADRQRRDDVVGVLQDERARLQLGHVGAVIGKEGHPREMLGDLWICRAEAVAELFAQCRLLGCPHDDGGHGTCPAEVVSLQRIEEGIDVGATKPADVVAVVDVAGRRTDHHVRREQVRRRDAGKQSDHGADRVSDEHRGRLGVLFQNVADILRVAVQSSVLVAVHKQIGRIYHTPPGRRG